MYSKYSPLIVHSIGSAWWILYLGRCVDVLRITQALLYVDLLALRSQVEQIENKWDINGEYCIQRAESLIHWKRHNRFSIRFSQFVHVSSLCIWPQGQKRAVKTVKGCKTLGAFQWCMYVVYFVLYIHITYIMYLYSINMKVSLSSRSGREESLVNLQKRRSLSDFKQLFPLIYTYIRLA